MTNVTLTAREWRREAELLGIEDAEGFPNAFLAAQKYSEDGSTSTLIRYDGSRVQYCNGQKVTI